MGRTIKHYIYAFGKDECCTAAGGAKAAISSLAYALWYDKDGARNRWRVNWDYVNKYGGLYSANHPNTSLYEGLTESFHTYDEILELTDRFRRQY